MASTRTPRGSWIGKGLQALAEGGPDAVRIEPLARELGVTKGGFYWHFDGRRALLEEMLDAWERVVIDEVIDRVEREGGEARANSRLSLARASPPRLSTRSMTSSIISSSQASSISSSSARRSAKKP